MNGDDGRGFFLVDEVDIDAEPEDVSSIDPVLLSEPEEVQRQMQEGEPASIDSQWEKAEEKSEKSEEKIQEGLPVSSDAVPPPVIFDQSQHDIAGMADDGQMAYIGTMGRNQDFEKGCCQQPVFDVVVEELHDCDDEEEERLIWPNIDSDSGDVMIVTESDNSDTETDPEVDFHVYIGPYAEVEEGPPYDADVSEEESDYEY